MSLLQNLPHLCTIARRRRQAIEGGAGSAVDVFVSLYTSVQCWAQVQRDWRQNDMQKREIHDPSKVYFSQDYGLDESHVIIITSMNDIDIALSSQKILSVVSNVAPDATAGIGLLWRVICEYRTGSTLNASEVSII